MNKNKKFKSILCFVLMICCLMSTVYAGAPDLIKETIKTSDGDNPDLIEEKSGLVFYSDSDIDGFKFAVDPDTGAITFGDGTTDASQGTIIITDSAGNSISVNISGNVLYDEDDGKFMINLGERLKDFSVGDTFTIQLKETDGTIHDGGEVDLSLKEAETKEQGFFAKLWAWVTDTASQVATLVEEILVELLLPLGDGILYMVSQSVGEVVTTSKLVYNKVEKVSVDYWSRGLGEKTVAGMMSKVVNPWYSVFNQIAIIVYMICLIIVGIRIMFSSTGEQKAKFKEGLASWVMGVVILVFFPYVMKYVVVINNTMIQSIADFAQGGVDEVVSKPGILKIDFGDAIATFGETAFVELMVKEDTTAGSTIEASSIKDSMMRLRLYAQYKKKVILVAVYFILIGQMLVILFMYYKRAFMVAFLITIFPLVAMTYVIDKMGDKKAQSFEIWFKEYIVNVIVQLFHAVVFAVIISMGVERYLNDDSQWLFMIISVLFLFEGEKILRNIFGIKSSANTIGDLAATGLATYGVAKSVGGLVGGGGDKASAQDVKDSKGIQERMAQRANMTSHSGANAAKPQGADPTNPAGGGNTAGTGSYEGDDPAGVGPAQQGDSSAARDTVLQKAMSRRLGRGFASKAISKTAKLAGAGIAATYGMSKGDTGSGIAANTLASATVGKAIGGVVAEPVAVVANKIEQKAQGNKVAKEIKNKDLDSALGLIDGTGVPPNLNPDEIIGKQGESVQEIYRQALAEMAKVAATKGKAKAELAFWNYIDEHTESKS